MKVLKFGGTSLANAQRMQQVAQIVLQQQQVLVVLSAVSGTTDELVKISAAISNKDFAKVKQLVAGLHSKYQQYNAELFAQKSNQRLADGYIDSQLAEIFEFQQKPFSISTENALLAKGELISTQLFFLYLSELQQSVQLLLSLDFLRLTEEQAPDESYLQRQLTNCMQENIKIYIAQGFICRNAFGDIANLKRGGSDYSASLFATAIDSEEIQIWTDIDGMHNNDPRYVKDTQPVRQISFNEAAELAYFGAKILHPSSIKPARRKNIPVRLLNTLQPDARGTLISSETEKQQIKAIAAKDGISAIKIRSSEMLQAQGFLRRIFEVFELYHTAIDMITTSEVAVSVTIDDPTHLKVIVNTLQEYARVEVDHQQSIICIVGENLMENKQILSSTINALKNLPIRMISYGGSAHNISLLVAQNLKEKALNQLHRALFNV